ncbi:S-methyl-5'-thioadenosine phosphorylase [candidate division KSB1 bacterium]|nr:S-methyl-5'-thioadenosine phosphorylase [candidate division KSB1 bacterium]
MARIGIIGGSGLYQMEGLTAVEKIKLSTPFGEPSGDYLLGELEGREVVFLPRHGRGHHIMPTEVNNRANIYGMKSLEVCWIISVSAVGSFRAELKPLDMIIIDQFVDRTTHGRASTFFGEGIVAHIPFSQPLCPSLRKLVYDEGVKMELPIKWGGTYLNMEGPAFSTLAESQLYKSWGMDVIGMTQICEAKLAREAEICYATIAMVTDYDCWWEAETLKSVTVDIVIENLNKNVSSARDLICRAVANMPQKQECECSHALANSIITDRNVWPKETLKKLGPIIQKYL